MKYQISKFIKTFLPIHEITTSQKKNENNNKNIQRLPLEKDGIVFSRETRDLIFATLSLRQHPRTLL
jgi:hypothetical protein